MEGRPRKDLASLAFSLLIIPHFISLAGGGLGRLNNHVRDYESLRMDVGFLAAYTQQRQAAKFGFTAFGREFCLNVKTHSAFFHPDFTLTVVRRDGITKTRPDMQHIVTGSVEGERTSRVYGRMSNGSFDGTIHTDKETYHIEPLHHHPHVTSDPRVGAAHDRIIYRTSDVEYDKVFGGCPSGNSTRLKLIQESGSDMTNHLPNLVRKKRQANDQNTCMIRIVADDRFFDSVGGGSDKNTLDEMVLHILDADNIYSKTTFYGDGGDIVGNRLSIHSSVIYSDTGPDNPLAGDFSVEELLEAFAEENFNDVCLGHLFTYRDYQGTIGLAYLGDPNGQRAGGICQKRTTTIIGDAK